MNTFNLSISEKEKRNHYQFLEKKPSKKNERIKRIFSQLTAYAGLFVSSKRDTQLNSLRAIDL